jgi:predicted nucleotidyltransferase
MRRYYLAPMDRNEAISRIKSQEAQLRAAGINALYLFGSTARGDARPNSDVDLACDLDQERAMSLLEFADLQLRLSDLLGAPVDLVERTYIRPRVMAHVRSDLMRVF